MLAAIISGQALSEKLLILSGSIDKSIFIIPDYIYIYICMKFIVSIGAIGSETIFLFWKWIRFRKKLTCSEKLRHAEYGTWSIGYNHGSWNFKKKSF